MECAFAWLLEVAGLRQSKNCMRTDYTFQQILEAIENCRTVFSETTSRVNDLCDLEQHQAHQQKREHSPKCKWHTADPESAELWKQLFYSTSGPASPVPLSAAVRMT